MPLVSQAFVLLAVAGLAAATWGMVALKPFTPGSDLGYGLGLAGGIMMLVLLLYPVRKRVRGLRRVGTMKPWFQMHMAFGILGPLCVAFHTTFTVSSVNALVALACMVVVSSSGLVGRYAYRRIHHGLYGRKATVQEFEDHMRTSERGLASLVRAIPDADRRLAAYREAALAKGGALRRLADLLALPWRARRLARSLDADVAALVAREGPGRGWDDATCERRAKRGGALVRAYLRAVNSAAQYDTYERIFSLWHVIHIPLVYLMVLSASWHVLAVHMY